MEKITAVNSQFSGMDLGPENYSVDLSLKLLGRWRKSGGAFAPPAPPSFAPLDI